MSSPPPLKPEVFEILAAMAGGELHGYAILKEIEERGTPMAASLLYRKLRRLLEDGWVEEVDTPLDDETDARRRYYRLTARGRQALEAEARRIVALADSERVREIATAGVGAEEAGRA